MEGEATCYGRFNGCWNFVQGSCCSVLHGVVTFRESNEKSYQLLRDSLDLYLTINPDNVQYLLLQARLYFHLGIWPEKVQDAKTLWFPLSSKLTIVWIYTIVCCVWSSVIGPRHPAAHSGLGPHPAWSSGLPSTAYSGAHSAQKTSRHTQGEAAERSGTLGGPVFSWPHHEAQEVRGFFCALEQTSSL